MNQRPATEQFASKSTSHILCWSDSLWQDASSSPDLSTDCTSYNHFPNNFHESANVNAIDAQRIPLAVPLGIFTYDECVSLIELDFNLIFLMSCLKLISNRILFLLDY